MRDRLCEDLFVSMKKGTSVPLGAREVFAIVESGCALSLEELENLPQELVDRIIDYRTIKHIVEFGGEMR